MTFTFKKMAFRVIKMAFEGNENDFCELWRSVFVLQIDVICAWERALGG